MSEPQYWDPECAEAIFDTSRIDEPEVRAAWLEERRTGLGGSDAAASMGLSPYASPLSLYLDKTDPRPDVDQELFEAGRRMEDPIAKWFSDKTAMPVAYVPVMLRSLRVPFMFADPDRYVFDDELGEWAILECKNVFVTKADEWDGGPPLHTRLQMQHYLFVTGRGRCWVAALIGGYHLVYFAVDRDDELIASMIAGEERLWTMVQMRRMPDVDASEATRNALKEHYRNSELESIEVPRRFKDLLEARAAHKAAEKASKSALSLIENEMLAMMQGAEVATCDGLLVATHKKSVVPGYTVAPFERAQWHTPKENK